MSSSESAWQVEVSVILSNFVAAEHGTYGKSCMWKAVKWVVLSALLVCSHLVGVNRPMCMQRFLWCA